MDYEAIITLGHEAKEGNLSDLCKQRLKETFRLYSKRRVPVVLSGGYSLKSKKFGLRESELMKKYALTLGINEKDIILETNSRDTQGNALYTKNIIESKGLSHILVVTSDFHLIKTKFFFNFIYGPNFKISCIGVPTKFSKEELLKIEEQERKSRDVMITIYKEKGINPGEDGKVKETLETFYAKFL